jgi:hypothetical protein
MPALARSIADLLATLEVASAELSGVKLQGLLDLPEPSAASWSLVPLATAEGHIRARIVDAHLVFDADVTVPIRQGQVDFNTATVAHVGPDSRMGVSRLGVYVDAANGRSYLYQFASPPVAGVDYERRGSFLGARVSDRGRLQLQAFAETLLRQGPAGHGPGLTQQSRMLFDRTSVSGEVRLGDGRFAAPGVQADLAGRAQGRNVVRLHSASVGRGLSIEIALLAVRNAVLDVHGTQVRCAEVTAALKLELFVEAGKVRFSFELANLKLAGIRVQPPAAA